MPVIPDGPITSGSLLKNKQTGVSGEYVRLLWDGTGALVICDNQYDTWHLDECEMVGWNIDSWFLLTKEDIERLLFLLAKDNQKDDLLLAFLLRLYENNKKSQKYRLEAK